MTGLGERNRPAILPEIARGSVAGVIAVVYQVAYATVIFSGQLTELMAPASCPPLGCFGGDRAVVLAQAISLMLFGTVAISLVTTFSSSYRRVIAVPQGVPAVILSVMATTLVTRMDDSAVGLEIFATVVATLVLSSVLAGVLFWLLGRFRLGRLVRYIPYPVIGGFLAGSGLLFVLGGLGLMIDRTVGVTSASALLDPEALVLWIPGVVLGVILLVVHRGWGHLLGLPLTLIAAIGAFHLAFELNVPLIADLQRSDLLLGRLPDGTLWHPDQVASIFDRAHWSMMGGQIGNIGALILVSVIALLVSCTGIELSARRDLELDRELRAAGLANALAGLGGSQVGYHDPSLSTLSASGERTDSRIPGIIVALVAVGAMLVGGAALPLLPRPVLGGLLVFLGLIFIYDWVLSTWRQHATSDHLLILTIALVIVIFGVLEGVALGIVLAAILFTTNYSRINVVRQSLAGDEIESNVDRSIEERRILREQADQIHVMKLQGFIFFGTAHRLFEQVKSRVRGASEPPPRFLILDFRRVIRIDSSAQNSLIKILRLAQAEDVNLILTNLSRQLQQTVTEAAQSYGLASAFQSFPDLDHGLEHCEEWLLADPGVDSDQSSQSFDEWLARQLGGNELVDRLARYMETIEVPHGAALVHQGEASDAMYLLKSGQLHAQLELDDGQSVRLRSMRAGAIVGEIGLLLDTDRSTSVLASEPSTVLKLSAEALELMEDRDPDVAQAFHRFVMRTLAERLVDNARVIRALSD
ncbi:MAG: SulP family inorganic anion transporter [Candidatus Bipolaricaulia bacterium]